MCINWCIELSLSLKLFLAFLGGAFIGWERQKTGHEAGIRTFGLISLGSCAFGLISIHAGGAEITRISAQIVTGIGFICAGVIFREQDGMLKGVTTAATLWCSATLGLALAYNLYVISMSTFVIILLFLSLKKTRLWKWIEPKKTPFDHHS